MSPESQAVQLFARECQVAVGQFMPPTDAIQVMNATYRAMRVYPDALEAFQSRRMACVFVALASHALAARALFPPPPAGPATTEYERGCHAIAVILDLYATRSLCLCEVARRLGVSHAYLCDVICRKSGYGFLTHLRAIRLLHGVVLLAATPDPIGRIARKCGFARSFQLARQFQATFGMTPTRFRRLVDAERAVCRLSKRNPGF